MTAEQVPSSPLRALQAGNIPEALRAQMRWAPWRAAWNPKRGKWDKVPCLANGYGLSTARPERWGSFEQAVAACRARPDLFAGVGYLMTGEHDVVGIDLDRCVHQVDGVDVIAPWAAEIVQALDSYAEVSPSGHGLRAFVRGRVPADWTNHEVGIEVYAGHEPRFLTVTGCRLEHRRADITAPAAPVLAGLSDRYARERSATSAQVINLHLPDLVDELLLPDVAGLDIPWQAREFLTEGATRGDRSRELFAAAVSLYGAGLHEGEVLSLLAASPHAFAVALDHRRQDHDRALMYLWVEHAQKAKGRATRALATAEDFDDVSDPTAPVQAKAPAAPAAPARFAGLSLDQVLDRPRPRWTIKRVLPESGVGMVYGPSTAGKSFFVLDLCMSVARGVEWRDRAVKQGAVAYVAAEGMGGFPDRVRAYLDYHGCDAGEVPLRIIPAAPNLLDGADVKDLVAALKTQPGLRVVVVDTLAQATAGADENASQDMGRALRHCQVISEATGALVLLVGHTGKDEDRGPRGHSSQIAAFDVAIQLERSGDLRAATVRKLKDGQGEGDEFPFHLGSVVLGSDEDGEDVTSCVVLPGNASGAKAAPRKLGPLQREIYNTALNMLDLDDSLTEAQLRAAVVAATPKPVNASDNRGRNVGREIGRLVSKGLLVNAGGFLQVGAL